MAILSLKPKYRPLEKRLAPILKRALIYSGRGGRLVEVCLVTDAEMRRLNRRFRGKDGSTTVLSFLADKSWPYSKSVKRPLGEICLAPDYIRKSGGDPAALLIHGLVHLLGYTHEKNRDRIKMAAKEKRLLTRISKNPNSKFKIRN